MKKCVMCNMSYTNEALSFCPRCHCRLIDEKPAPNIPRCPTCNSTNVTKISAVKKATGFALVGIFSSNFGKTMQCKNCGYKW